MMQASKPLPRGQSDQSKERLLEELARLRTRVAQLERQSQVSPSADPRASLERFFQTIPLSLCILDAESRYVHINETLAALNGKPIAEHIGRSPHDIIPEVYSQVEWAYRQVLDTREAIRGIEFQSTVPSESGEHAWLLDVYPLTSPSGEADGTCTVIHDITEQKKTEKALRESNEEMRAIYDRLSDGIIIADVENTQFLRTNDAMSRMLGYTHEEITSLTVQDVHPAEDLPEMLKLFAAMARGEVYRGENIRLLRKDGTTFLVDIATTINITYQGRRCIVGIFRDVTDRNRIQRELREARDELEDRVILRTSELAHSESRWRALMATVPDTIVQFDRDGTIQYVNRSIVGSPADFVGHSIYEYNLPEYHQTVKQCIERVIATGCAGEFESEVDAGDGVVRWFSSRVSAIGDGTSAGGLMMITTDVTDRRRTERRLRDRQAELAHVGRLNTMGEMASGIAHELNQPLHAIKNYARGCVRRLEANVDRKQLAAGLDQIAGEADRAAEIIRRLRRMVRKNEPHQTPVEVRELIEKAVQLLAFDANRRKVEIALELADDAPLVSADPIQVEQVIINLARNAFDAMEDVETPDRVLTIGTQTGDGPWVEVVVRDRGSGVPPDQAETLFDAFFTTKSHGLGMGLSISRSIIEMHGGRLWLSHNTAEGTTFHFTLPISAGDKAHGK